MDSDAACFGTPDLDAVQEQRDAMFSRNSRTRFADVTDGLSQTLMLGANRWGRSSSLVVLPRLAITDLAGVGVSEVDTWVGEHSCEFGEAVGSQSVIVFVLDMASAGNRFSAAM